MKKDKTSIYKRIFIDECNKYTELPLSDTKLCHDCIVKMCVAGVKWLGSLSINDLEKHKSFNEKAIDSVLQGLVILKADKIAELFPPHKDFDGDKYGCKDYFTAKDAIHVASKMRLTKHNIARFLEDLTNYDMWNFCVSVQWYLNNIDLRKQQKALNEIRQSVAKDFDDCIVITKYGFNIL